MTDPTIIPVALSPDALAALDAWIVRAKGSPSRGEAIALLVAGALGSHSPSSVVPSLVTGRDIV